MPVQNKTADALASLAEAVKANTEILKEALKPKEVQETVSQAKDPEAPMEAQTSSHIPIPLEYRQIVDAGLNKAFGIEIEPLFDSPQFTFVIVVPEKYSTMSEEYKKLYKRDLRPKVISYADGANGVRSWVEKVFNSFSQDYKSMIVGDRVQGH